MGKEVQRMKKGHIITNSGVEWCQKGCTHYLGCENITHAPGQAEQVREAAAPSVARRISALKKAHHLGIPTAVSLEPWYPEVDAALDSTGKPYLVKKELGEIVGV